MEDNPDNIFTVVWFIIICIVIPLVMAYRRGYLLHLRWRYKDLIHLFIPPYAPKEWIVTSVKRLSWFDRLQIESIWIKHDYTKNENFIRILIKGGKTIDYTLAEDKGIPSGTFLDKKKILFRRLERENSNPYYDIMTI